MRLGSRSPDEFIQLLNKKNIIGSTNVDLDSYVELKFENENVADLVKFSKIQIVYSQSVGDSQSVGNKSQQTIVLE